MLLSLVAAVIAITPETGDALPITRITINGSPGDQVDPHVHDDLAAYSNFAGVQEIRFYRFSTGADQAIVNFEPEGTRSIDQLSDVNSGRIAFTRINSANTKSAVMLYDVTLASVEPIEINAQEDTNRSDSAIGGNSVVYVDRVSTFTPQPGQIFHFDLVTGIATQLSSSGLNDTDPQVSADGNVVVWQRCETLLGCDVVQAVRQPDATFSEVDVANSADEENQPDTDGTYVVYVANRANSMSGADVYFRTVSGGPEQQLELGGIQSNPTISAGVIAFESADGPMSPSDIMLYEIATNRLFRITDTFFNNEALNDVTVLNDGSVRVVWQSDDDSDGFSTNVYGATFGVPPVNPDLCEGVVCDTPPAATCTGPNTLTNYSNPGSCAEGVCSYVESQTSCAFGCSGGECLPPPDPCTGVTCNTPPPAACTGPNTLTTYASTGTCSSGTCSYAATNTTCAHGCSAGACLPPPDPCAGVTCNTPPAATCTGPNTLTTYASTGTCSAGTCSYAATNTACSSGCSNGACLPPPVCTRSVTLTASKRHTPRDSWTDDTEVINPVLRTTIPASLTVTQGNAGNKRALVLITMPNGVVTCTYKGGANSAHPTTPAQIAAGQKYNLAKCIRLALPGEVGDDDGSDPENPSPPCNNLLCRLRRLFKRVPAGTVTNATGAYLHITDGDDRAGQTTATLQLNEYCGP